MEKSLAQPLSGRIDSAIVLPDRYATIGGIRTRYWQMGDSGSPILLLHGGNGSIEFWLYNIAPLAAHHRVYAFDMFGCGRSAPTLDQDYSLTAQAQFIRAFMVEMGLERVHLLGNSMGGGAAQRFAHLFPNSLDRLILSAPLGWGQEINLGLRLLTLPGLLWWLRPNRAMIPAMLSWNFAHPENLPPDWIERRYEIFALPGRQKAIAALANRNLNLWGVRTEVYEPLLAALPKITHQTLVLWGAQDRVLPVAHAQQAKLLPNHRAEIWPDCGHHPFLEFPDRFNSLVLEFLKSND
jgi:pimeloyl-ACP methyl ester carboxylesterase